MQGVQSRIKAKNRLYGPVVSPNPLTITVVDASGRKSWTLTGRAAVIVQLILDNRQEINALTAGNVEFHVSPDGRITPRLLKTLEGARCA